MRLLWLIDSLTTGGAESLTAALAGEARRRGWKWTVAFLKRLGDDGYEAAVRATGVPVVHLRARHLRDAAAYRRLARLLRTGGFDLVHAHLAYASIWGAVAAPRAGLPLVATLHVAPPQVPALSREGLRQRLLRTLLARRADRVVAVSHAVAGAWTEAGLPADGLLVVHNGIDLAAYAAGLDAGGEARRQLALPPRAPVIATVTVLRAGKGLEVLLDALALLHRDHPDAVLVVAGDGPLRQPLAARAAGLGLDGAVRWAGFRQDVPRLLAAADLFVLPSRWDAFPTAVLEAMAAGLPVVSTRAGGIPEIVEDKATGLLVPPGDAPALAAALARLLDAGPERRAAMGRRGRDRVGERFSLTAWGDRLEALYRAVLAGRGGAP